MGVLRVILSIVFVSMSVQAEAVPILWHFDNANFSDGGSMVGSFVYDADADFSYNPISDFSITVSGGDVAVFPSITYDASSATSSVFRIPPFLQFPPIGIEGLIQFQQTIASANPDTPGLRQRDIQFLTNTPLSNAGGTVTIKTTGFYVGAECYACAPFRLLTDGSSLRGTAMSAVPEPASWAMMVVGFFGLASILRRQRSGLIYA